MDKDFKNLLKYGAITLISLFTIIKGVNYLKQRDNNVHTKERIEYLEKVQGVLNNPSYKEYLDKRVEYAKFLEKKFSVNPRKLEKKVDAVCGENPLAD